MSWYIKSYEEAVCIMHTARSPKVKGKPLNTFMRMYDMGTHLSAGVQRNSYYTEIFKVTPDNKLTFTADVHIIRRHAASLTWKLNEVCPVTLTRRATLKYVLSTGGKHRDQTNYYQGATVDLSTLDFDNPRLDSDLVVIPEVNTEWRRVLAAWRKGLIVRCKVGAFDSLVEQYREWAMSRLRGVSTPFGPFTKSFEEASLWDRSLPTGASPWLDLLSSSMKEGKYPPLLIIGLMHFNSRMGHTFLFTAPGEFALKSHIISGFEQFVNNNRQALKKRFGVYHDINEERVGDTPIVGVDPS